LGISWTNKCAFGPIPEPDLFMTDVSICCLHVTWWAYLEDHFNKPTFFFFYPATDDPDDAAYIDYYENQLRAMVKFIEDNTNSVFDIERLKETVRHSDLTGLYWKKIMELRKHKPSPASFRHLAGQILPLVTALGEKDAADFYLQSQQPDGYDLAVRGTRGAPAGTWRALRCRGGRGLRRVRRQGVCH
jgi:benzoyl-CoA reductase/2-hydroxyglutaryl-CoA dehydratase subunit BcrC/BadD/HgdB